MRRIEWTGGVLVVLGVSVLALFQVISRNHFFEASVQHNAFAQATAENTAWLRKARNTLPLSDRLLAVGVRPEEFLEQALRDLRQATPDERHLVLQELLTTLKANDKDTLQGARARSTWLWSLRPQRGLYPGSLDDRLFIQETRRQALQIAATLSRSESEKLATTQIFLTLAQRPELRANVLESAAKIPGTPRPELLATCAGYARDYADNPRVAELAFALLARGEKLALPYLAELLKNSNNAVADNAFRALKALREKRENLRDAMEPLLVQNEVDQSLQMQIFRWIFEKDPEPTLYVAEARAALDRLAQIDLVKARENEVQDMDFLLKILSALPMQGLEAQESLMLWARPPFTPLNEVRGQLQSRVVNFLLQSPWMEDVPTRLNLQEAQKNYELQRKNLKGAATLAR
jgi:hypothetical protein